MPGRPGRIRRMLTAVKAMSFDGLCSELTAVQRRFMPKRLRKKLPKMASTPSMKQVAEGSVRRSMRWGERSPKSAPCQMWIA
jgi:hypothetical protein